MGFDPVSLADRFAHTVVADVEAAAEHANVRQVLTVAAQALLPGVDLPGDADDVVALLKAAGEVVHRAIDMKSAERTIASDAAPEAAPAPTPPPATG